jgi:hypothetical protein
VRDKEQETMVGTETESTQMEEAALVEDLRTTPIV